MNNPNIASRKVEPMAKIELSDLEETTAPASTHMDPRLQLLVASMRTGTVKTATASTAEDEVGVIARVSDSDAWLSLSEVRDATVIGIISHHSIVTGRIPVSRIEKVRDQPFVESLKAAQPLRPMLTKALEETQAEPSQLPVGNQANGGKGVVVGIVDYDGDFVHLNFRKANGKTRLLKLWDQNAGNTPSSPFGYGVEHSQASLDLAVNQADPYAAIGYFPRPSAHGTHVMDIAAGNGNGSGVPGMAPNADLIFVNVTHDMDPSRPRDIVGSSFGDSVTLLEALKYVFDEANERPSVVNVSLGTNGGPHDGTTLVDQGIDALVSAAPNRAVVIAAANSYDDGIHAAGRVVPGATFDLIWNVTTTLLRPIELELWYAGSDQFKVELFGPNGVLIATALPGETKQSLSGTTLAALLANRLDDPNNHDNMIGVFMAAGMPGGDYIVRLTGEVVSNGEFHAWIERDNSRQSKFKAPSDNAYTLGSLSCGKKVIAVGSYDAKSVSKQLSYFSSSGPTRDGRMKPEISAPGHDIWAAKSLSKSGVEQKRGTSMASPCVAGIIALMFAEAAARGLSLTIDQTTQIITRTARRNPPNEPGWHSRYGHGRISATEAVRAVINMNSSGASTSTVTTVN